MRHSSISACCAAPSRAVERTRCSVSRERCHRPTAEPSETAASNPTGTGFRRHQRHERSTVADRPGLDRLAGEEAAQVVGQLAGGRVAAGRRLGHRLQADRLQVARDLVVEPARRPRLVLQHLQQEHAAVAAERPLAGEQLVEDDAEAVDVAAGVDRVRLAAGLLGRHVGRRAEHLAVGRHRRVVGVALGQAEVHEVRLAVGVEQDVRRLDVAVDDAERVRAAERVGDLGDEARGGVRLERPRP